MKPIMLTQEAKDKAFEMFKKLLDSATGEGDLKINITTETLLQAQGIEKPIVFVAAAAYVKMVSLINSSSEELAWYGIAHRAAHNYFIEDILVYPQTVTSATVDADEEKCAKWFMELPDEVINNLKFQGHSHVNMGVSPSGRDTGNWQQFANLLKPNEFYLLCIGNKRGEFHWNIYDRAINVHFENKDITMIIVDEQGNSIANWATESINKYIEKQKPIVTSRTGYFNSATDSQPVTTQTRGKSYTLVPDKKEHKAKLDKSLNEVYEEMLSYVPDEFRDDIDYEPESDMYFTYNHSIPKFYYSRIYDCYTCEGERFRAAHPKTKRGPGRPKKENK